MDRRWQTVDAAIAAAAAEVVAWVFLGLPLTAQALELPLRFRRGLYSADQPTENDDGTEHASGQPPKDRGPGGRSSERRQDLNRVGEKAPSGPPDDDAGQAQDPDVPELQRDVETLGERKWQDCRILEVLDCGGVEITGTFPIWLEETHPVVFLPLSGAIDLLDGLIDGLRAHGVQVDGFVTVTSEGGE